MTSTATGCGPGTAGFRYHACMHYFTSLPMASGADAKVGEARLGHASALRHGSALTTLDTHGHLWPNADDSAQAAIEAVMAARADRLRTAAGGG